ncbi:MAG: recombinase family protein [Bdellovibrionales bacterium]|nr:recombinase family protein [Bdellovibrionales bacterium]
MIYAYCRVSTDNQNNDNQLQNIERYCKSHDLLIDRIINIKVSSRSKERDLSFISELKPGDKVIVSALDRLGRSTRELLIIINSIQTAMSELVIIDKNLTIKADKSDLSSTILVTVLSLVAEIERQLISDRTKSALARIRLEKKLGRPRKIESVLQTKALELKNNGKKISQIAAELSISRQKVYRILSASTFETQETSNY